MKLKRRRKATDAEDYDGHIQKYYTYLGFRFSEVEEKPFKATSKYCSNRRRLLLNDVRHHITFVFGSSVLGLDFLWWQFQMA